MSRLAKAWRGLDNPKRFAVGDPSKLIAICREVPAEGAIAAAPHVFPAEETIPMWKFLYGKHLMRGTVSVTAAAGGVGKSTKSVADALAQTTGRALVGTSVPAGQL